ncbi:hypothetical protein KXD97_22115 [Mycobacterium sp. SMC-8]|uniref:hypothetical protein n=1 Tax=Mycobacterium sp. SMC-8 TaxID=2857060 RepID=UPI0021B44614|nr:hypothetical protein [Mycobacterium sp. SMC-8]UXA10758.1 hypothetical protein KXD97_22115 [Mycobacterium sp. SMC-8]
MTTTDRDNCVGYAHPSSRPASSWRGTLGVLASRGETTGPRVEEAQVALSWHRLTDAIRAEAERGFLTESRAESLINQLPAEGGAP